MKAIFIIYLIIPLNLFAQDLTGIWEGHLIQDNQTYQFKIKIISKDSLVNFIGYTILNNPTNKEKTEITKHF